MNSYAILETHPHQGLIDAMQDIRSGMLGTEGSERPMQPMTHFPEWERNRLWFLTSRHSALVQELIPGTRANYCVMDPQAGFDACLIGMLSQDKDRAQLDAIWSPVAAAWFKGGKSDPDLTMLRLDLTEAALWSNTNNVLNFGYEILKANLNPNAKPDLGVHKVLLF